MRKWVSAAIGGLCLLTLGRGALAASATDGTLITNVASASYQSAAGLQFWVTYNATQWVLVSNPCVALTKRATPTQQSSGGVVTFELCVINCSSSASSFNINVYDRLPDWMGTIEATVFSQWPASPVWTPWNNSAYAGAYNAGLPASQAAPWYLRFNLTMLGIGQSSCMTWRASVL